MWYIHDMLRRVIDSIKAVLKGARPTDSWKDTEIMRLRLEVDALQKKRRTVIPIIEVGINDPEPTDEKQRQSYVTEFANFFDALLQKKLKHLIAQVREDLDWSGYRNRDYPTGLPEGMTRAEFDAYLRGTSNAFRVLLEYGEQMRAEATVYNNINKDNS